MILDVEKSLVLIIDVQEKLLNAVFNKDIVEKKSKILVKAASLLDVPIIISEQYPKGLGESIDGFKNSGHTFTKTSFNALCNNDLKKCIEEKKKKSIIVCGIETHICVYQTVIDLIKRDFDVTLVLDACGSRSFEEYNSALSLMQNYGAKIKTTEMILFEWLKTSNHEKFKEIQALIK